MTRAAIALLLPACGNYPSPPLAEAPQFTVAVSEREAPCLSAMPASVDLRDGWSWRYACWWGEDDAGPCLTCAARPCECVRYPDSAWAP